MAVLTWPNEALTKVAEPVPQGEHVRHIIDEMFEAMNYPHGIGIAAPQLGYNLRIICINVPAMKNGKVVAGSTRFAIINPEITWWKGGPTLGYEGCLSFPDVKVAVPRYDRMRVRGYDVRWNHFTTTAHGLVARVLAHEIDHLYGRTLDYYAKLAESVMGEEKPHETNTDNPVDFPK